MGGLLSTGPTPSSFQLIWINFFFFFLFSFQFCGILLRLAFGPLSTLHATFWCIINSGSLTMVAEILILCNIFKIYLATKVRIRIPLQIHNVFQPASFNNMNHEQVFKRIRFFLLGCNTVNLAVRGEILCVIPRPGHLHRGNIWSKGLAPESSPKY